MIIRKDSSNSSLEELVIFIRDQTKIEYPLVILEDAEHKTKKIHLNHIKPCQSKSLGSFSF